MLDPKVVIGDALRGGLNGEQLKQRVIEELKRRGMKKLASTVLTNPIFWIIVAVILGLYLFFLLLATMVSNNTSVSSSAFVTERVVPPQIYYRDIETILTSDFGERTDPVTGKTAFHNGIDFGLPVGTPIISSFDGVVTTVSYPSSNSTESNYNAGIYVAVKSADPELDATTRYLHLSDAFVTPGQAVRRGEIIGLSGNTGKSTGPHLHYEWIPTGADPVDPTMFIMMMSKATDAASKEAFRAMDKVRWTTESGDYDYRSRKLLYLSGVYMETPAPAFNTTGTVSIRKLGGGHVSSRTGNGTETEAPQDTEIVTVPPDLGSLTHPFFMKYAAAAQEEERRSGIPASITLAQAAIESGYGNSSICNNVFGIKANRGYDGPTCSAETNEEYGGEVVRTVAVFRAYDSVLESFADHSDFLLENPRYRFALAQENPYAFANELQRAGYATDSQYANKLKAIIRSQNLAILDANGGIDPETGQPFADVPFFGGSGGGAGDGSVTFVFGIQQVYGDYAKKVNRRTVTVRNPLTGATTSHEVVTRSNLMDPTFNKPIINLVNYNNVINYGYSGETEAPDMYVKDLPSAIMVTLTGGTDEDLFVSNVQYVRGTY
ncbi:glucosaminidase domain-containing protein [Paenibacillus rubinfantis]|uniref:glucosaminidase domain-containing protein n=1 Tax=Paenibacillus rubinfantis TaxID=1720296 RepID=UPI00073F830D|nr:glucosaminidase domain-containing protein [Paenibacillus rubinfantis]